ncbi:MAG: M4 family metallopeptidase [Gammaproteobacteria bacterium]
MKLQTIKAICLSHLMLALPFVNVYAATPVDLTKVNPARLQTLLSTPTAANHFQFKELQRELDFKKMLHIRIQQTYSGYPVWGGDAIVHVKEGEKYSAIPLQNSFITDSRASLNGIMYQDLQSDLTRVPQAVFSSAQAQKALDKAVKSYQEQVHKKLQADDQKTQLMVYVDDHNKAHWAYLISFKTHATQKNEPPAIPTYIVDAVSFSIYEYWNDMQTHQDQTDLDNVSAGGFGGNIKSGQLTYDGLQSHLAALSVQRDSASQICYFKNDSINLKKCLGFDYWQSCSEEVAFETPCQQTDEAHNNIYWNGDSDKVNDGYSPGNDAFFNGQVTNKMYREWIGVPVLKNPDGTPMVLTMIVHLTKFDNAYWDGKAMYFGDGDTMFYPLTSLGVTAHEVSHGFTQQHSNLQYRRQSGGMNEAYSDMAAKAAEYYAYGKDLNWQIAPEIFKAEDEALRYMDLPSKDCKGRHPGSSCSIDDAGQYNNSIDVHYSSGVYNRFFYLLSTSQGWNTKQAFQVMAHANAYYWTSTTNFQNGACGVLKAGTELGYDLDAIQEAFKVVKIDTSKCS